MSAATEVDEQIVSANKATKVLRRWIFEGKNRLGKVDSQNLLVGLDQVLQIWFHIEENERSRSVSLELFQDSVRAGILPNSRAYSILISILAKRPDLSDTLPLAEAVMNHFAVSREADLDLWSTYLNLLARCSPYVSNAAEKAEDVLKNQMKIEPDSRCWESLLKAWTRAKDQSEAPIERAEALLKHIMDNNHGATTNMLNIVINAWARQGDGDRAELLLRQTLCGDYAALPDAMSFLGVMKAWKTSRAANAADRAKLLLDFMSTTEREDLKVTIEIYTCVLEILAEKADSGPIVEKLLIELKSSSSGLRPTPLTYTAAIQAWGKSNNPLRAQSLLEEMEEQAKLGEETLLPDRYVYTAAIRAWVDSDHPESLNNAFSLLRTMENLDERGRKNIAPSIVTYNNIVFALTKHGDLSTAHEVLRLLHKHPDDIRPDSITYSTIIQAHASQSSGSMKVAKELLTEMEDLFDSGNLNENPSPFLYASVIRAHAKSTSGSTTEDAEAMLWHLQNRFSSNKCKEGPNTAVVNSVIFVWLRSREANSPERIQSLINWMDVNTTRGFNHLKPNLYTFNLLMEAWAFSRRKVAFHKIKELHEKLAKYELSPDAWSFTHLLNSIKHSSSIDKSGSALAILRSMTNAGCHPNIQIFRVLLEICTFPGCNTARSQKLLQHTVKEVINVELAFDESLVATVLLAYYSLRMRDQVLVAEFLGYAEKLGLSKADIQSQLHKTLTQNEIDDLFESAVLLQEDHS